MRWGRNILIALLCFNSLVSYTQIKYGIKNIYAFYTERLPGNIPVNRNGKSLYKGPDTLITIYVEASGKGPEWKTACRDDRNYIISSSLVSKTPYEAGTKVEDGEKVLLIPAGENKLWQLNLLQTDEKIYRPRKTKPGEVLLRGKFRDKIIFWRINSLVQLTAFPSV